VDLSSFALSAFGGGGGGALIEITALSPSFELSDFDSGDSTFGRFAGDCFMCSSLRVGFLRTKVFLETGFPAKTASPSPSPSVAEKES
jgi:hypothetical protein